VILLCLVVVCQPELIDCGR